MCVCLFVFLSPLLPVCGNYFGLVSSTWKFKVKLFYHCFSVEVFSIEVKLNKVSVKFLCVFLILYRGHTSLLFLFVCFENALILL